MINELLNRVEGADVYMAFSLILFLAFFIAVGIYVFRTRKEYIIKMKNLPLEDMETEKGGSHVA